MSGRVERIFIASDKGEPMQEVQQIKALAGVGLEGDRYAGKRGLFSRLGNLNHVTLIEQENIDRVASSFNKPFLAQETRRNIVVSNFPLADLVGKVFTIGTIRMRGTEIALPCTAPAKLLGRPGNEWLEFKMQYPGSCAGLRAEVLSTGIISVSDDVTEL